jgi:hypothetical protein
MRILVAALVAFLAVFPVANAQEEDAGAAKVGSFHISSLNSAFAMQGDFEGEYRIHPDRIELKLTKSDVRLSEHRPYKGRRLLSALKFGLATKTEDDNWKIALPWQAVSLERVMSPGDEHSLGELHFNIPIDASTDLSRHWLVAQMDELILDVPERRMIGRSYARSCQDIFAQP